MVNLDKTKWKGRYIWLIFFLSSESQGWEKKKKLEAIVHVGKFFFGPFSFHLVPFLVGKTLVECTLQSEDFFLGPLIIWMMREDEREIVWMMYVCYVK